MRARPALAAALVAAAAALALRPVEYLRVENERWGTTLRIPLERGEPFAVVSIHSMYDAPVTEEFVVDAHDEIVLEAVSSPSAAVREYFGLTGAGERHAVVRAMPRIVFRVAAGPAQLLRARGDERSFLDLGDHGDRLVLSAGRAPAALRWLASLRSLAPIRPHS
jgi:hypothetical protein